ncbi:unnamed protein product [marine sediment metagenome]|uniref:Uncharacterized protein n=1 Tax=marine sediment metagenome TaxID=412755 RepID=X1GKW3_9ZZZZ
MGNSHELQKAQYAYDAAVRDRVPLYDYKGIKLGYSGGYNDYIGDPPPTGNSTFANTFNLILPIIDQITLNSSLQLSIHLGQGDTVTGGSIGISINPFPVFPVEPALQLNFGLV